MKFSTAMKVFCSIKIAFMLGAVWYWWTRTERAAISLVGYIVLAYFVGFLVGALVVMPFTEIPEEKPMEEKQFNDRLADVLRGYWKSKTTDTPAANPSVEVAQSMTTNEIKANYYGRFD